MSTQRLAGIPLQGEVPEVHEWEFLLSHHQPNRWSRTVVVAARGKKVHLCSRCTGQAIGILTFLTVLGLHHVLNIALFTPIWQFPFALFPLPAALDWLTQSLGKRESSNSIRLVTGALLGSAFVDVVALVLLGMWLYFLIAIAILLGYVVLLSAVLFITGGWRKVVEEHFPGVATS